MGVLDHDRVPDHVHVRDLALDQDLEDQTLTDQALKDLLLIVLQVFVGTQDARSVDASGNTLHTSVRVHYFCPLKGSFKGFF